jgi:hypothetical protein
LSTKEKDIEFLCFSSKSAIILFEKSNKLAIEALNINFCLQLFCSLMKKNAQDTPTPLVTVGDGP